MRKKKTAQKKEDAEMLEYVYSFELMRHYPSTRSYLMKNPLKPSLKGTFTELIFGKKRE